jgi:hypothetical protein
VLSNQASLEQRFLFEALFRLLGEEEVNEILDEMIPPAPAAQTMMFGRTLGTYSGLSRTRLKALYGFTDEQVDAIFDALGVTTGRAAGGAEAAAASVGAGDTVALGSSAVIAMKGKEDDRQGANEGQVEGTVTQFKQFVPGTTVETDDDGTLVGEVDSTGSPETPPDPEQPTEPSGPTEPTDEGGSTDEGSSEEGGGSDESSVDSQPASARKKNRGGK